MFITSCSTCTTYSLLQIAYVFTLAFVKPVLIWCCSNLLLIDNCC
uniref:Uncharacterized protein n=1 Tax=Arundo donax TaxID=35708 RepID=A0A0A9CTA1_ARUDO